MEPLNNTKIKRTSKIFHITLKIVKFEPNGIFLCLFIAKRHMGAWGESLSDYNGGHVFSILIYLSKQRNNFLNGLKKILLGSSFDQKEYYEEERLLHTPSFLEHKIIKRN